MIRSFRNWFISGLLLLSPVAVTIFVVNFLIQRLGVPTRRIMFRRIQFDPANEIWLEFGLNLIALLAVVALITALGWLSRLFIGRMIISYFERIVDNLPLVRTVYNTVKQIRDTFVQQNKAVFQQTVLIEYPRKGIWAIGFLTGSSRGETQQKTSANLVNIFMPTTPNPTSGFLLMVPREDVVFLEMSVGDGMKLIISGGAVVPPYPYSKNASVEVTDSEALITGLKPDQSPQPAHPASPPKDT